MATDKATLDYGTRVKRGPSGSEPGPRTRDEKAIDAMQRFFDSDEEWKDVYEEIDRRDPNMRSTGG